MDDRLEAIARWRRAQASADEFRRDIGLWGVEKRTVSLEVLGRWGDKQAVADELQRLIPRPPGRPQERNRAGALSVPDGHPAHEEQA